MKYKTSILVFTVCLLFGGCTYEQKDPGTSGYDSNLRDSSKPFTRDTLPTDTGQTNKTAIPDSLHVQ